MTQLIGEFDCKLDAKGRLSVPSSLKKQLLDVERDGLVVSRGFEQNLIIYPRKVWSDIVADMMKLNMYVPENREFVRKFQRGATELSLDAAGRVLLPKSLTDFAGIGSEVILACQLDRIEVWDKKAYDDLFNDSPEDFAKLAEKVMGGMNKGGEDGK
ncbi:division/cell wall cluster transcriptional repressor MraZ [Pedobacter sp. ASV28]|uniref:division/cell wall cluster transcriptional repressor MraZ n=1 Tax=Pedobacter sp. ASV28 TaxID=2795123 RepID=UPI0018EE3740|nr:division/cell wall cluster transcriptional repressor MraZ [Pedobacter sp. ASV28]